MGTPTLTLMYDRRKRATSTKEGAIELRICHSSIKKYATTGVRVLPKQWRNGRIVNRLDAYELQRTLDMYVTHARQVINDLMQRGEFDIRTVVAQINEKQKETASANVTPKHLLPYLKERAEIRKYGCTADTQERYDRFLRWFEQWGGMVTFDDVTEANVLKMDEALIKKGMKTYSKWNNYHRFLNSYIIDAVNDGLVRRNPYKHVNIEQDKSSGGIGKYLTMDEFRRLERLNPPTNFLRHALDLFIFQTYTCLSYIDLATFDARNIKTVRGRQMYTANRGKTRQEFTFLLLKGARDVLARNNNRLPIMSNAKYNECLKVLASMAKINKPVSSHWARHTGATMLLNLGVEMEVVAKVLGHSSTRITRQVYAKLLDDTVADSMSKVEKSLEKARNKEKRGIANRIRSQI